MVDLVVKQQKVKGNGSPRQVFFLLFSSAFPFFSFLFFEWVLGLAPIAIVVGLPLLVVPATPPMVVVLLLPLMPTMPLVVVILLLMGLSLPGQK